MAVTPNSSMYSCSNSSSNSNSRSKGAKEWPRVRTGRSQGLCMLIACIQVVDACLAVWMHPTGSVCIPYKARASGKHTTICHNLCMHLISCCTLAVGASVKRPGPTI
jgi:hypothetical protein